MHLKKIWGAGWRGEKERTEIICRCEMIFPIPQCTWSIRSITPTKQSLFPGLTYKITSRLGFMLCSCHLFTSLKGSDSLQLPRKQIVAGFFHHTHTRTHKHLCALKNPQKVTSMVPQKTETWKRHILVQHHGQSDTQSLQQYWLSIKELPLKNTTKQKSTFVGQTDRKSVV